LLDYLDGKLPVEQARTISNEIVHDEELAARIRVYQLLASVATQLNSTARLQEMVTRG
jgi:anti-sigma-K factor RskA